jgi:hypothetical protein
MLLPLKSDHISQRVIVHTRGCRQTAVHARGRPQDIRVWTHHQILWKRPSTKKIIIVMNNWENITWQNAIPFHVIVQLTTKFEQQKKSVEIKLFLSVQTELWETTFNQLYLVDRKYLSKPCKNLSNDQWPADLYYLTWRNSHSLKINAFCGRNKDCTWYFSAHRPRFY